MLKIWSKAAEKRLPYSIFAAVYDKTMQEIPYHNWAYFIFQKLDSSKIGNSDKVLDIGSGTGVVSAKLAAYFNVIALDISRDMLEIAKNERGLNCIQSTMQQLPFSKSSFAAAFSTHDCINYLKGEAELKKHFTEVGTVLKKNGIYIFDCSTEYNVIRYFHNHTFIEKHGRYAMKWSNVYNRENKEVISEIKVTEFAKGWPVLQRFRKKKHYQEIHVQKIFDESTIENVCQKSGFKILKKLYDYNESADPEYAHIIVFIAQKV